MKMHGLNRLLTAVTLSGAWLLAPATHAKRLGGELVKRRDLAEQEPSDNGESSVILAKITTDLGRALFYGLKDDPTHLTIQWTPYKAEDDYLADYIGNKAADGETPSPVEFFELLATKAGFDHPSPPSELMDAYKALLLSPESNTQDGVPDPYEKTTLVQGQEPKGGRRQLGSDEWFQERYCHYAFAPDLDICKCYPWVQGDGQVLTKSENGLLQRVYNTGFQGPMGHKLEYRLCLGALGSWSCHWIELGRDKSVASYELSTLWTLSSGSVKHWYRTTVFDADGVIDDMYHLAINELRLNFFGGGCDEDGRGCYECPNSWE